MRVGAAAALIAKGSAALAVTSIEAVATCAVSIMAGALLAAGLWTPIAGLVAAVLGLWQIAGRHSGHEGDAWAGILLIILGVSLALLGPGAWSVDAKLFGWRQIEIRERKR